MDRLLYSRLALIKSIILILLFAMPMAAGIIIAPELLEGRGSGRIGLLLRFAGPQGDLVIAGFCALVLAALTFRAARLLCGTGIAARFDAQGLVLDNGWRVRTISWREVLGADVLIQEVRVRGTVRSFETLTIRLILPDGSERQSKLHLRELESDCATASRWCEAMREAQQRALQKPMPTSGVDRVPAPAARSFGRRVVNP